MAFSYLKNQKGVSLIAAVVTMVLLAVLGVVFASLISVNQQSMVNHLRSTQAFFIADGGLERVVRFLLSPTLSERGTCSSIDGNVNLTNISLGSGLFTVTTYGTAPYYPSPTTLNGNINSSVTTIPVNDPPGTANYASYGRIMIDREIIDYTDKTSNSFTGALRGRDGTIAASHVSDTDGDGNSDDTRVGQYQCTTTATGGVPDLTTANRAQRRVSQGVQLQEGWAVGDCVNLNGDGDCFDLNENEVILQWNGTSWSRWGPSATTTDNVNLNSVNMLSYADGWAVGDRSGNNFNFLRWNGSQWTSMQVNSPSYREDLNSVFMISSTDGWAVGNRRGVGGGNRRFTILKWDGGTWTPLAPPPSSPSIPSDRSYNQDLNSIYMWDTDNDGNADDGWAVGDNGFCYNPPSCTISRSIVLRWNGASASWSPVQPPAEATANLSSVFMVSQNDIWMVGDDRGGGPNALAFRRLNGAWIPYTDTDPGVDRDLNSIFMLDTNADGYADDGWAVGDTSGGRPTMLRWNYTCTGASQNNQWNNCTGSAPNTGQRLNAVYMVSRIDGWAVGNGGTILHWDGSSWTEHSQSRVVTTQNLNGISLIGSRSRPHAMWREVYN